MTVLREYQRREEEFLQCAKDLNETTTLHDAEKQKYDSLQSLWKKRLSMSLCQWLASVPSPSSSRRCIRSMPPISQLQQLLDLIPF